MDLCDATQTPIYGWRTLSCLALRRLLFTQETKRDSLYREIFRILRPGGSLYMTFQTEQLLWQRARNRAGSLISDLTGFPRNKHVRPAYSLDPSGRIFLFDYFYYTDIVMRRTLQNNGFVQVKIKGRTVACIKR